MAAVAPGGAAQPVPTINSASVARYRGSAPINFRLILVNTFVLLGCAYVLVTAYARYDTALTDLDTVARTSVLGAKPCGLAVPRLKFLFESLKEIGDDAFAEDQESIYINRARNAMCGTSSINNAIRSALQAPEIEDDCCSAYDEDDPRYRSKDDLDKSVRNYVCACASETCTNGHGLGDMVRRIQHAYVLAAPAFAVYVDSDNSGNTCASPNDPFSATSCASADASITQAIHAELEAAATNSFKILAGKDQATAPWPTTTKMLYRLMALSVIEYYDRTLNDGKCFANVGSSGVAAVQFCKDKLANSIALPDAAATRPLGDAWTGGCANAAEHKYYAERLANSDSCTYNASSDPASKKTPLWTQRPRKFSEEYEKEGTLPVYAVCSSMLEFGLLDRKRLFGLPDPVGEYEWYSEHSGSSFTRWLGGIGYWGLFDANKDKSECADKHTAYLDLKLYVGYRYAVTSAWVLAAFIACGYLLAFSSVPFLKLLYIRLIRRTLANTRTDTILLKPTGSAEYIALVTTVIVGLWVIFVDPAGGTPYVVTPDCDAYARHGGAFVTTAGRARDGLLGLTLILLGAGLLLYTVCCRRPPKRQRIMPLDPFPLWPIMALVVVVLLAALLLMIRAGDDWWKRESTDLDGSASKTTQDFEDIVGAVLWVLLCLGLLMGILNQRHMAANVVLNVPRGRPVVFAYLWVGVAFAAAVVAAVFAWPLFDCQVAWTTNELICGDGTEITIQWNYFFGCVAFVACIAAIFFVFWASFKVLFTVPRKDDPRSTAFNKSKDQEIAQLNQRRFGGGGGGVAAAAPGNPFGTGASAMAAGVSAAAVTESLTAHSDDDYDVYGDMESVERAASPASSTGSREDRVKFNLAGVCAKGRSNVLSEAQLLPVGVPIVSAAFVRHAESEEAPLIPQARPVATRDARLR
jgi:hypothetical protein